MDCSLPRRMTLNVLDSSMNTMDIAMTQTTMSSAVVQEMEEKLP